MDSTSQLQTERLLLRPWRESDLAPLCEMTADPRVMEDLPAPMSRPESEALIARIQSHFCDHGFGLWAIEVPGETEFIGFAGLWRACFESAFTPCVEIGWRLTTSHWGRGYATEAAEVLLGLAFRQLELEEVVGLAVAENRRSRRVMEKLGMQADPKVEFQHPLLPAGHPLRRQVLYRIGRHTWQARAL
jgi:RimJ/RimL family protein N-acetyltransferase